MRNRFIVINKEIPNVCTAKYILKYESSWDDYKELNASLVFCDMTHTNFFFSVLLVTSALCGTDFEWDSSSKYVDPGPYLVFIMPHDLHHCMEENVFINQKILCFTVSHCNSKVLSLLVLIDEMDVCFPSVLPCCEEER